MWYVHGTSKTPLLEKYSWFTGTRWVLLRNVGFVGSVKPGWEITSNLLLVKTWAKNSSDILVHTICSSRLLVSQHITSFEQQCVCAVFYCSCHLV